MRRSLLLAFFVVFALSCSSRSTQNLSENKTAEALQSADSAPGVDASSVVLTVPVGPSGISYASTDVEEQEPWGPAALRLGPDGTIYIVNTVADNVLRFRRDGTPMPTLNLGDRVVGITDVVANNNDIYVLDESAPVPKVLRLTNEGQVQESRSLSPDALQRGLSGLAMADNGAVMLEFNNKAANQTLDNQPSLDRSLRGKPYTVDVPPLNKQGANGARATLKLDGQQIAEIKVDNLVAGAKVLSTAANGDVFVLVDEIAATPEVNIDQTVRRYRPDGTLVGMARVPIRDMFTPLQNNVVIDSDGQALAAVTRKTDLVVIKLKFETQLQPILTTPPSQPQVATPTDAPCTVTRAQMIATAKGFRNNMVFLSLANLNGTCAGRGKPRYLGNVAGEYKSVAYDWGGWDTVAAYNQFKAEGRQAGDINTGGITGGVEACSKGVDCSGFVTRCWGITSQKYGTATLPEISTPISVDELLPGDIFNRVGRHVVLFDRYATSDEGGGVWVWESTTSAKRDRVVYLRRDLSELDDPYVARRYNKVCP